MSTWLTRDAGTVRSATPADALALSQLMACVGTDNLPITVADVTALLDRGRLLVLDLGAGVLGAAVHVTPVRMGRTHRAAVRYLAVHPALAGSDLRLRMTEATLDLCDALDVAGIESETALHEQVHALRGEIARRLAPLMVLLLAVPRVIASMGRDGAAGVALVWSALALFTALRRPRLPRAIVRRPRTAAFRA
jgi:hypothetical protein